MFSLFNRLSRFVAIGIWIAVIPSDELWIKLVFGILLGLLIKGIFFSDWFIKKALGAKEKEVILPTRLSPTELYAEEITSEKAKIPIENLDSLSQETGEIDDLERQHVVLFNLFRERVGIGDFIFPKKIKDGNNYLTALRVGKEDSQPWYEWIYEDGTTVKGLQEEKILNKVLTLLSQETSSLSDSDKAHSPLWKHHIIPDTPEEPSVIGTYIKGFFKENLLAKIGGILVFLGVLFFLSLIWTKIPDLGKLLLGFVIGIGVYFVGVFLNKKDLKGEAMVLLWTGILVNFLVILGGRYLLGVNCGGCAESFTPFLSSTLTLILLIINTVFGVRTALRYHSQTLLLFWFLFAYLTPFLIGASSDTPYFLLGYTLIITLGAYVIGIKQKNKILMIASYVLANVSILLAPSAFSIGAIAKLASSVVLGLATLCFLYKQHLTSEVTRIAIGNYVFLFLGSVLVSNGTFTGNTALLTIWISLLLLTGVTYFLSKDNPRMYTIGTLGSITILFPFIDFNVVSSQEWAKTISIGLLTLFFLAYTIYPLVHRDILKNHLHHLLWGHLVATLFVLIEIYQYGHAYFNDAHLGLSFLVASIFFAIISFLIYGFTQEESAKNLPENTTLKWSRHLYLASAITAFSLAIAFLASGHASLISILRLLESSILFYFFSKIKEKQRYYAGMVLMGIGLLKTVFLIPTVSSGERTMLIPLIFILATLVYNLRITQKLSVELQESEFFILHDVFNFVGMVLMGIFLRRLLPSTVYGRGLLGLTCFWVVLSGIYSTFASKFLKTSFFIGMGGLMLFQIVMFSPTQHLLEAHGLEHLTRIQYLVTALIIIATFIWHYGNKEKFRRYVFNTMTIVYLLIMGSIEIQHLFSNTFIITFVRGSIATALLVRGISHEKSWKRTLGLYILLLVLAKVFLFDIRYGLDNAISRVVVCLILGSLLIFISTKYSKKYGAKLAGEFDIMNMYP